MNLEKINPKKLKRFTKQQLLDYIEKLEDRLEQAQSKNNDLELLLETITELATGLENEIHARNKEMIVYINQVKRVTEAAVAVENDTFEENSLDEVAARTDTLGTLARVFEEMVSNLKSREKQLADAKEQLEAVLNAVPGTISWISADGFYIGVNQHLAQTLHLSPDKFVGKNLNFLESSPEFSLFINNFIKSNQKSITEEVPIYIEGEKRYYLMVAQKYNQEKALVSVGIDITDRRKAQQDLELQRNSFARFVPAQYLQFLKRDSIVNIQLGDHVSREMAMLFSDIRSFTSIAENMSPQEIFNFVNGYLGRVSPVIQGNNGFIIKYIGDSIMAAFPDCVNDAVNSGVAHLDRVKHYNKELKKAGYIPIKVGIGIHTGYIMVGVVGEPQRMQGDALSDSVNLAARLESLTKVYGVSLLISDSLLAKLENVQQYHIRFLDRATVKGRQGPINLYEVLDGEEEEIIDLKLKTQKDFDEALAFYREGKWLKAQKYFEKMLQVHEEDQIPLLYLSRIEKLKTKVTAKNWDGIWRFSQK